MLNASWSTCNVLISQWICPLFALSLIYKSVPKLFLWEKSMATINISGTRAKFIRITKVLASTKQAGGSAVFEHYVFASELFATTGPHCQELFEPYGLYSTRTKSSALCVFVLLRWKRIGIQIAQFETVQTTGPDWLILQDIGFCAISWYTTSQIKLCTWCKSLHTSSSHVICPVSLPESFRSPMVVISAKDLLRCTQRGVYQRQKAKRCNSYTKQNWRNFRTRKNVNSLLHYSPSPLRSIEHINGKWTAIYLLHRQNKWQRLALHWELGILLNAATIPSEWHFHHRRFVGRQRCQPLRNVFFKMPTLVPSFHSQKMVSTKV